MTARGLKQGAKQGTTQDGASWYMAKLDALAGSEDMVPNIMQMRESFQADWTQRYHKWFLSALAQTLDNDKSAGPWALPGRWGTLDTPGQRRKKPDEHSGRRTGASRTAPWLIPGSSCPPGGCLPTCWEEPAHCQWEDHNFHGGTQWVDRLNMCSYC